MNDAQPENSVEQMKRHTFTNCWWTHQDGTVEPFGYWNIGDSFFEGLSLVCVR